LRPRQLSDDVASYLRQAIMAGEFIPGQSIRADAIGEQLSVSATPVREALQALKVEGFLDLIPRKGFTVAPLAAQDIRDIFEAHALIAGELAARAAVKAQPEQISELEALHHELMAAAHRNDHEALEQKNHGFHRLVYQIADSQRLHWSLGIFTRYVPRRFYAQIEGWPATTADDHSAVIEAIARHDPDAARTAMTEHIRHAGEQLATHYEKQSRLSV
jgi:DNA-binding GntR family transcriptional regulator